jgi:putative restriction endonuclease
MVRLYIGNTDNDWFDFLRSEPNVSEINFWQPSPKSFRAVGTGEFFVFRLKSPRNVVGGFGVFANATQLSIRMAWEAFGRLNGVPSEEALVRAIQAYRPDTLVSPQTLIVCRVLVQPVFFEPREWRALPNSWSGNIVGGKTYDTSEPEGMSLWEECNDALEKHTQLAGFAEAQARFGGPTLIRPRLGQGAFRVAVIEAYHRQCALSLGKVLPALDSAHIRPYRLGGSHEKKNGILLRRDIHSVFDAGYATFDNDYRFVVSNRVKEVFDNGNEYRRLHGRFLTLPESPLDHPDKAALTWHRDERFEK